MASSDVEMTIDDSSDDESQCTSSDESDNDSNFNEDFEESDTDEPNRDPIFEMPWTEKGIPRPAFHFTSNSGVQVNNLKDILQIFEYFLHDDLIDIIVRETNRYPSQYICSNQDKLKPNSRAKKWFDTDSNEIRTFIGLLILQSICPKPEYKMYFTRRESIETPVYSEVIGERRFHLLLKFLHFVHNSTQNPRTKSRILIKVLPVLEMLIKVYVSLCTRTKQP
ncbi:unnamed protein product [Acanthoscelides obtectus]|uniref:PiggyBac transposable element-derived protein domain-containing protein n=1 Tax=Acanthoscelides obtectus TaxID=200917 RepID=A0A9P0NTR3_ACAOB|nr:unnamed protein product [Acanthoscelides obtectus]CAK1661526.1 PiggyBac transposable element-derived protein 4 [Acanthoscelides obtectus]